MVTIVAVVLGAVFYGVKFGLENDTRNDLRAAAESIALSERTQILLGGDSRSGTDATSTDAADGRVALSSLPAARVGA